MQLIRRKKRDDKAGAATLDLYYASDVHGSDQCWRKFLGAGRFYGVSALIMGGDLTGKAIVPITIDDESFTANMIVSDADLASDIPGVQTLWVQGVGCGTARAVNFSR